LEKGKRERQNRKEKKSRWAGGIGNTRIMMKEYGK
jgi:hypothetical protein